MRARISVGTVHGEFVRQIESISGVNLLTCNQCGKCSAGCPVAFALEDQPNQVIRMAQLGIESVLDSETLWVCASCLTCAARCPKGVDLPRVMEALRQIALRRGDDHLRVAEIDPGLIAEAPPLALIGGFRKYTR